MGWVVGAIGFGGRIALRLTRAGATGTPTGTPDGPAWDFTDDLDVAVLVKHPNWAPVNPSIETFAAQWGGGVGNRNFLFRLDSLGKLNFVVRLPGTNREPSSEALGFAPGSTHWVRATYVAATGDITFYKAPDAPVPAWVQVGTPFTGPGGGREASTGRVALGAWSGNDQQMGADIFRVVIRSVVGGTIAGSPDFESAQAGATSVTDAQGNVWTVDDGETIGPA